MEFSRLRFLFHTRQFDRSLDFYERILGMRRIAGWDRPDSRGVLLAASPTAIVEIIGVPEGDARGYERPSGMLLMLEVDDADGAYERLTRMGARVEAPPHAQPWGHRLFVVRDPDGVVIHIHSPARAEP